MIVTYVVLGSVGALGIGLYLVRRWRSSMWGVCTSTRRLEGQVIIITGGNTGLGAEAAEDLARRGATLILACRNFDNTRETIKYIRAKTGNNDVHYMHLDLGSLQSVREFAREVLAAHPQIHTLVCNAGVWVPMEQRSKTKDGFEIHAGVNHLGHFLLTSLLLERLVESAPSRVVVVSSGLMNQGQLDFEINDHFVAGRQPDPTKKSRGHAPIGYCDSKLMNALFVKELAVRTQGRGIMSVCLCPGWCYTQLARHVPIPFYKKCLLAPFAFMFMRSAKQGAQNIIQAVVEEEQNLKCGGFYKDCKIAQPEEAKLSLLTDVQETLWQTSVTLTGQEEGNPELL